MFNFIFILLSLLVITFPAFANPACAVCTGAVGAFLEVSRKLGVDDAVVGVWFGAFLMLIAFWLIKFCAGRRWSFKGLNIILVILTFSLILPISTMGYIPYGARTLLGIDTFLLSSIIGAIIIWSTDILYRYLKEKNGGHAHFPFEKVVIPVFSLLIASLIFYFMSDYFFTSPSISLPQFDSVK